MKKQEILDYLKSNKEYFYNNFGVQFIGIFGSFARNEENMSSDIDILYKLGRGKKLSIFKYLKLNQQLENHFHKNIDLVRDETLKPQIRSYIHKDLSYV